MKTFNRGTLKKLVAARRVLMVGSYNFDDMLGESRSGAECTIPVAPRAGGDFRSRKDGICYLGDWDFKTGSGCAYYDYAGAPDRVTLIIHSNHNLNLKILPEPYDEKLLEIPWTCYLCKATIDAYTRSTTCPHTDPPGTPATSRGGIT